MGEESAPVALITGAAGGVGQAVMHALTARGYAVIASDVSPAVESLAAAGSANGSGAVRPLVADAGKSESARAGVALAERDFGRLDLLVNNAARFIRRPLAASTDDDFDALLTTNLRSAFVHSRESCELLGRTRGSIINVTSISGLVGMPNQSLYAMTKGALVQLTRQLAIELAPSGVRVNAVAPGAIDTEFIAEARAADPDPAATAAAVLSQHPLGRISTPSDVAEAIAFLASQSASGITGVILSVDGGYVAR